LTILVRDLQAADAASLTELFTRCYGNTYGSPVFYDTPALKALIANGRLKSVVAADGSRLVGHTGITIRHPGALVCETGNTVVDPAARGQGLLKKLGAALRERVLREGFIGYVHYPTTAHDIMQRASVTSGGVETGVMLSYIAATTQYEAVEQRAGRLAATVAYQPFAAAPSREVTLPARYTTLIEEIYRACELTRPPLQSASSGQQAEIADLASADHAERGLLSLYLKQAGKDLGEQVDTLIRQHQPKVTHIDLPLDTVHVDEMVGQLVGLGFFFCAVLPEFSHTDVLRLQALHTPAAEDFEPDLVNAQAKKLCASMRAEIG
jgi:GNAT superfamily N-acetyltransferase